MGIGGGRRGDGARLWRRCQRTVDALELPDPFDAAGFIGTLAQRRGRAIELIPVTARPDIPCGLLVTTDRADYVLYAADTTRLHQQHILLHEAAHLLCGHHETAPAGSAAAQVMLPHLSAGLVRRVLGRTVYSEPQEREAELTASLILHRVACRGPGATGGDPAGASWAESVFGAPGRGVARRGRNGRRSHGG